MTKRERMARGQRARQVAQAGRVERELLAGYREAWQTIRAEVIQAVEAIKAAEAAGGPVGQLRHLKVQRLAALEEQVATEIQYQLNLRAVQITDAQANALLDGKLNAIQLLEASLPPGFQPQFPAEAFRQLVGFSADGQPLGLLLSELGSEAGQQVRKTLTSGLAMGLNPNDVARRSRDALGGNMVRSTTIARTEILRAYRTAALGVYQENADVIEGWVWMAQLDGNTCPACIAMHGNLQHDESFDSHPNCRCTLVPQTKPWAELGVPDAGETRLEMETGEDWFARQPEPLQRTILGPQKLAAYQQGKITLPDMVQRTRSERWGGGRRERSLQSALRVAA